MWDIDRIGHVTNDEKADLIADLNTARALARTIDVFVEVFEVPDPAKQELSYVAARTEEILALQVKRLHEVT